MHPHNKPLGINIELTTRCPLRCPQCYCSLENGKDIPIALVRKYIEEAALLGVDHVELSGGETLCYPHLLDAIRIANENRLYSSISTSGWNFSKELLNKLIESGIGSIHISLNAPTEEKNSETREGFQNAVHALEILSECNFENTIINWVMHRDYVALLPEMVKLAEKYKVGTILIIEPRPNAKGAFDTYPTMEDMFFVADMCRHNETKVQLVVQHCFSPLLALKSQNSLWGNMNIGPYKGCTAGQYSFCIDVDGHFIPCRHLLIPEEFDTCEDYWEQSRVLKEIRTAFINPEAPCSECKMLRNCRHCIADNYQFTGRVFFGNKNCVLQTRFLK